MKEQSHQDGKFYGPLVERTRLPNTKYIELINFYQISKIL